MWNHFSEYFWADQYLPAESAANQDILQECLKGLNIGPETGRPTSSAHHFFLTAAVWAENESFYGTFPRKEFSSFSNFSTEGTAGFEPPPEQQQLQNPVVIGGCALPGQQQYPVMFEGAAGEAGLPEQPARPMEGAVGGAYNGQLAEQFLLSMSKTRDDFSKLMDAAVKMKWAFFSLQKFKNDTHYKMLKLSIYDFWKKVMCQYEQ